MNQTPTSVIFAVREMSCGACVRHVGEALATNKAVASHHVDLAAGQVTVAFDASGTTPEAIAQALDEAGYPASPLS